MDDELVLTEEKTDQFLAGRTVELEPEFLVKCLGAFDVFYSEVCPDSFWFHGDVGFGMVLTIDRDCSSNNLFHRKRLGLTFVWYFYGFSIFESKGQISVKQRYFHFFDKAFDLMAEEVQQNWKSSNEIGRELSIPADRVRS